MRSSLSPVRALALYLKLLPQAEGEYRGSAPAGPPKMHAFVVQPAPHIASRPGSAWATAQPENKGNTMAKIPKG
jgi:hypothetical protein